MLFGMILGGYTAVFVKEHVAWFAGAVIILGVGLAIRWFTAEPS